MKSGLPWFDNMVNRTNRTLVVPACGTYVSNLSLLGALPTNAVIHWPPFVLVSILNFFTPASGPSPQAPNEASAKLVTSTAFGSLITTFRGPLSGCPRCCPQRRIPNPNRGQVDQVRTAPNGA